MPFFSKEITDALFRQIFESELIGLFFTTSDGKIVSANKTFLDCIGYTAEDIKNKSLNWRDITPPEFIETSEEIDIVLRDKGITPFYEKEYLKKDGSRIQMLMRSAQIKDSKNFDNVTYAIDISKRKQIEKDLANARDDLEARVDDRTKDLTEANLFLQSLFDNIPNMIFVKDAKDLKFVRFNKAGENLLGIKRDNLIGKSDKDFFPIEEADFFIQKDRDVLKKKTILDIPEERISTKYGVRILHTKKIPILDSNNNPKFLLGISEDITDVKNSEEERHQLIRAQAAREEAEKTVKRLELLADASTLLTSSLDYQITLKNFYDFIMTRMADWCHITLYKSDEKESPQFVLETEALEKNIANELKQRPWRLIDDIGKAVSADKKDQELFLELKKANFRSIIHVNLKARGNNLGYLLLGTKVGSNQTFGLAELQLAEELAEKASLAIDNSRLFSEAQKANQLKDEFLATLSHELRTPLNIIHGYSELLKNFSDKMTDKEKSESLDAIHRNAIDQTNIINDILDVSRIITGKMNLNLSLLSPAESIISVTKNTAHMAKVKNIKLITQLPESTVLVTMDPIRLQQIIWNLISNAIKFTPSGGEILIKNYLDKDHCIIEVSDNGIGVSPQFLPHIFERFRQEDGSMTRKYGGLGLGLAIVRHLVEMHGGTIEAHSAGKNLGTQFIVKLPIALSGTPVKSKKKQDFPDNYLDKVKILLVEDSRDTRLLITRLLATYGAEIQEADSAPMARELLKSFQPDVILCDIEMPGENGVQFISSLRKSNNHIPAIALTAYAREEEKEQFLSAGFQSHIPKPASIQVLLTEIRNAV